MNTKHIRVVYLHLAGGETPKQFSHSPSYGTSVPTCFIYVVRRARVAWRKPIDQAESLEWVEAPPSRETLLTYTHLDAEAGPSLGYQLRCDRGEGGGDGSCITLGDLVFPRLGRESFFFSLSLSIVYVCVCQYKCKLTISGHTADILGPPSPPAPP